MKIQIPNLRHETIYRKKHEIKEDIDNNNNKTNVCCWWDWQVKDKILTQIKIKGQNEDLTNQNVITLANNWFSRNKYGV